MGVLESVPSEKSPKKYKWEDSSGSGSTVVLDCPPRVPDPSANPTMFDLDLPRGMERGRSARLALDNYLVALLEGGARARVDDTEDSDASSRNVTSPEEKTKHYYKFWALPKRFIKVRFDRLALLALLDR